MITAALSLAVFTVIVGVGQMFVITLGPGNVDLSLPANIGLASAVAMKVMDGNDAMIAVGLLAAVACGMAVGAANYLLIWALRIPPIIATLSASFIIQSIDISYGRGLQIKPPPSFANFTNWQILGIPVLAILTVLFTIGAAIALQRMIYGRSVLAIGQNIRAAWLAGVNVGRIRFLTYTLSGALGGLDGALLAGYFRGWVDTLIMRIMDVILAFPSLLLALVLVAILGPGLFNAMLAIALVLQPHFARLTRAAVMAEKNREYVISAKVAGASHLRLMVKTILPNCMAPLIVQATLSFSNAILEAAALGFLGVGAQPPTPEWGTMLATAREFILRAPWVVTFPGLAILITVLAINLIGDGLRDAFDPKLKRS
ncbi:MAG: ABC transporter permease subunit [Mesorhizobium sp.]|nr:MAG: ABC transporter permease subunit [Mesorhizobium sp.]